MKKAKKHGFVLHDVAIFVVNFLKKQKQLSKEKMSTIWFLTISKRTKKGYLLAGVFLKKRTSKHCLPQMLLISLFPAKNRLFFDSFKVSSFSSICSEPMGPHK
jgi:hypothetical protein